MRRYQLGARIGEGGGGVVRRARDRALERDVALKRVPLTNPEAEARFARELDALRGLAHPHLVRLLDLGYGQDADGPFGYHTAELLEARPFDVWAQGRDPEEIRRALIGPVRALRALHDAGLMHGDVSASNVLVDDRGHATLIDLGLVRPMGEALHTVDGTHVAPEVYEGAVASSALDRFALGHVIAGALGERLRAHDPAARPTLGEVLEALGDDAPARPVPPRTLIGRDDALAALDAWLDEGPPLLVLGGPPGVGKSRLLEELKHRAQRSHEVDEALGVRGLARMLERAGPLPDVLGRAAKRPVLWLVDELSHDAERLWTIVRALEPTRSVRIALVGDAPNTLEARTLTLSPLSDDDVRRWIGARTSPETRDAIVAAAAGVPADVELALGAPGEDPARALETRSVSHASLAAMPEAWRRALLVVACGGEPRASEAVEALVARGWLRRDAGLVKLRRPGDAPRVRGAAGAALLVETHRALAARTEGPERIRHLAHAGALDEAERALEESTASAEVLAEAADALADHRPSLRTAELLEGAGRARRAIELTARRRRDADAHEVDALRLVAGRCRLALGDPRGALRHLRRAARADDRALANDATEQLAVALSRRGDHRAAVQALRALEAPSAEALGLLGVALSFLGEHGEAAETLRRAAAGSLSPRARLRVVSFVAIDAYRRGDLREAARGYREAYGIASRHGFTEQLPQTALNLATIEHRAGELGAALRRYDEALLWARAHERASTEVTLRTNRARLFAELGAFERARHAAREAGALAARRGLPFFEAEAFAIEAELDAAEGLDEETLAQRALAAYAAVGADREVRDTWLVVAALRLNADDVGGAAEALARADDPTGPEDLRARALEVQARVRVREGRDPEALEALEAACALAEAEPELLARLCMRRARVLERLGAPRAAKPLAERALALWDRAAATLPEAFKDGYVGHPDRARPDAPGEDPAPSTVRRLLTVAARVAEATDPDAVLELAMDSAVELTGAERGFVLLADADGQGIEVAVARNFDREDLARASDKFSRTIAERVIARAEPVLTSEAQRDERFREGRSVHAMQLRSVLCVPIRTSAAVLGALYVDNRFRRGRFGPAQVELLAGFASQVASSLTQARLVRELEERTRELDAERARIAALLADKTAEVERLAAIRGGAEGFHGVVGRSAPMRELSQRVSRLAETNVTVLIEGESGAGKEVVARAIHRAGPRRELPFVSVSCGAIPQSLLESELFGHVRGAFTGATSDKTGLFLEAGEGTLMLDEIGEMPLDMQVKLLRALQEREVRPVGASRPVPWRARVVAATNRTLADEVQTGGFREDLYYRLAVVELRVPPLRERREDIPELAEALLARATADGLPRAKLTAGAARALQEHDWPGNVRQLENVLRAAAVFAERGRITADTLVLPPSRTRAPAESEREILVRALHRHGWNVSKVGRELQIPRMTLYRRLRKYELERPKSLAKRESTPYAK